ncbi:hypothetical protein V3589_15230 [Sinorhizobium fredii]|uniref:hypothetical protein n=1 Tax=Rhizobium fredii TaxID=380 RepID=UPI00309875FF
MTDKGFFHPDRGYWQTIEEPSQDVLAAYPAGTVEVPLKPGEYYEWIDDAWVEVLPTPEELRETMPTLSAAQYRQGMLGAGHNPQEVTDAIAAMPDGPEKESIAIEWEYATFYDRLDTFVVVVGDLLGMTPEETDDMWMAAATIPNKHRRR